MDIDFKDKQQLYLIETDRASETGLSVPVIRSCRNKFIFIRSAKDERDLRNWKSLYYEKLLGDREGQRSIRLNDKWRLVFTIENTRIPPLMTILSVEDYH